MGEKRLTGRIAAERVRVTELPRLPAEVIAGFRALPDLTSLVSDVLDELGLSRAVPGSVLTPTIPGTRLVGQALTLKNVLRPDAGTAEAVRGGSRLADIECHNLAQAGDVLVIEGVEQVSSMGRISATIGKRQGEVGAVVQGAVRDVEYTRSLGYPIWSSGVSPITGKYRLESVEVNGTVTIHGIAVEAGDLVLADEVGVVFVPRAQAALVLARARAVAVEEQQRLQRIAAGVPVPDVAQVPKAPHA